MFCQREITSKIFEDDGNYLLPVRENQPEIQGEITTAFNESVFPSRLGRPHQKPAKVGLNNDRLSFCQWRLSASTCVNDGQVFSPLSGSFERERAYKNGAGYLTPKNETVCLISGPKKPDPIGVLVLNRGHWGIDFMYQDKDVTRGEDQYTNRLDHAPRNIFSRRGAVHTTLKGIHKSPTRAIEIVQDN